MRGRPQQWSQASGLSGRHLNAHERFFEMTTEARAYFQAGEKEHEPAYMEVDQEAMTDLQA